MKNIKRIASIGVLVFITTAAIIYLSANRHLLDALFDISLTSLIVLVFLGILFTGTNGLFLQAFTRKFEIHLNFVEWFGLAIITAMGNYISPFSGGMIARATYLKQKHKFAYAKFAALLASNYLIAFFVVGVVGTVTSLNVLSKLGNGILVLLFFVAETIAITALFFLPNTQIPGKFWVIQSLNEAIAGWQVVKNDQSLLLRLVLYTLINIILNATSFYVAYLALGIQVTFEASLLVSLIAMFSIFINITPGNFGIQETVVSIISALIGMGAGEGLLAALLIRASMIVSVFTLGPIFGYILTQKLAEPFTSPEN